MGLVIFILAAIGILVIFFAGTALNDNDEIFFFCPLIIGIMVIAAAIIIMEDYVGEESIRKYVNNEVTYDTVAINKEGKLLEIKVIKNE